MSGDGELYDSVKSIVAKLYVLRHSCAGIIHNEKNDKNKIYSTNFDLFWGAYPQKVGKRYAFKCWAKSNGKPSIEIILKAIEDQKKSKKWKDGYIPNPSTWINQGRWEDEIQEQKPQRKSTWEQMEDD